MFSNRVTAGSANHPKGFTLIEMLVVIGVVLILISIGVPNYMNVLKRARITDAKVKVKTYSAAVAQYHSDTRQFPESGSWHLYYILTGQAPFDSRTSKRYNPPYGDFTPSEVGRIVAEGSSSDYKTTYEADSDLQIKVAEAPNGNFSPISSAEMFPESPYASASNPVRFFPLIDPWRRPIIYISPKDLEARFKNTPGRDTRWDTFMALSEQQRRANDGDERLDAVPFAMETGQIWSAGPDGSTARGNPSSPGLFQPGNLTGDDGRDNDNDSRTDASDSSPGGGEDKLGEDDINSWS